jgi:hypothetical protein
MSVWHETKVSITAVDQSVVLIIIICLEQINEGLRRVDYQL